MREQNLDLMELAASHLEELLGEVAFVGGCAVALLITDPAAPEVRPTYDVDLIVEIVSHAGYYKLIDRLKALGFHEDNSEGAPLCRFRGHELVLDVMPTDSKILGFTNRWYTDALAGADSVSLPSGREIRLVSAPYFIATKLEAFTGRGGGDYLASHDLEDIIAVIDGRPELTAEVETSPDELRDYLAKAIDALLADPDFLEALPGHLPGDQSGQQRVPVVFERMKELTDI